MLHILLVEDSDADVGLIQEGFKRSGIAADVQLVHNSEQALRLMRDLIKPDFIVLDIYLPRLDAVTVLKHCRSLDGAPPVIMKAGSGSDCKRWRVLELGTLDYIANPTSFAAFVNRLNEVVERWNVIYRFDFMVLEVGVEKKIPLKARKLLYLRSARNAKTAKSAYFWHVYGTRTS